MRICQKNSRFAWFQNNYPGKKHTYRKNGSYNETRTSQNTKTFTIVYGKYSPSYEIHSQFGRIYRTTKTTIEKNHQKQSPTLKRNTLESIRKYLTENKTNYREQTLRCNKKTRIKCDASDKGLGASIEQKHDKVWHTIGFACRF